MSKWTATQWVPVQCEVKELSFDDTENLARLQKASSELVSYLRIQLIRNDGNIPKSWKLAELMKDIDRLTF